MIETVIELVKDVGFPIVAFLLMYVQSNKAIAQNTQAVNELAILLRRIR